MSVLFLMGVHALSAEKEDMPAEPNATLHQDGTSASQATQKSADPDTSGPVQPDFPGVTRELIKVDEPGKPFIYFYYPVLGNERVDEAHKQFAEASIQQFLGDVEGSDLENRELSATYSISKPNDDIVSVTYNVYSFEGGAHGNLVIYCLNQDLKTGETLKLGDIFQNPEKALEIMSELSFQKLSKNLGEDADEDMIRDGTAPVEDNFSKLSLTPTGLIVEFQPYQVGPWSLGSQEVPFSLEELRDAGPFPRIWPEAAPSEHIGH